MGGLVGSAAAYGSWLITILLISNRESEALFQFANRIGSITLICLLSNIAIALTSNFVLDRHWKRWNDQQHFGHVEQIRRATKQLSEQRREISSLVERITALESQTEQTHDHTIPRVTHQNGSGSDTRSDCEFYT
jgi:hypothetical protein